MPALNETLAELNLTANPFAATTPLETLFPGGIRRASLDQLKLLSRESSDIVALVGPEGCGKTTLADFYARRAERDQIVARTRASMLTSPSQLLQEMFKAFVLDFPANASMAELKAALLRYFQAVRSQSRSVVLIVDDAHELGDDAFSLLVKLALVENHDATFHVILVGQASLLDMLDYTCPQHEGQNQFTSVRLPEFNLDETRNYLRYRLNAVGFNDTDPARPLPFSARQIEKIHKLSQGNPGRINLVAEELLFSSGSTLSWLPPFPEIRLSTPYAIAAGGLVLVLAIALLFGSGDDAPTMSQRQIALPTPVVESALPIPLTDEQDAASPFVQSVPQPAPRPETHVQTASPDTAAVPVPETPAVAELALPTSPEVQADVEQLAAPAPAVASAVTAPTPTPTPTPTQVPAPVAATPAAPTAPASAPSAQRPRDQILAFPPNEYTVQLLGAASRANVEAFVARHPASPLYWFETTNQGRPWFVVIHGHYPNQAAAQSAAAGLTGELGRLEPWIRRLGAVQTEVRAGN